MQIGQIVGFSQVPKFVFGSNAGRELCKQDRDQQFTAKGGRAALDRLQWTSRGPA